MGRTYAFECAKCGYRARVSGRADRGVFFFVQTILCRDCKQLYDAVIRWRIPADPTQGGRRSPDAPLLPKLLNQSRLAKSPPSFVHVLNRLPDAGSKRFRWVEFKVQCPVSPTHRIQSWNDPGKCPRCGLYLDKTALPFRIWD